MKKRLNSELLSRQWRPLLQLIEQLTPNEKGYFMKSSLGFSKQEMPMYVKLFRILGEATAKSDKEIKQKLGNSSINIHGLRTFLYEQILKNLRAFHSEKSIQSKLRLYLDYAEILTDKGLLEQSQRFVDKGIQLGDPVTLPVYQILFQTHQIQLLRSLEESVKIARTDTLVNSITESADNIKHAHVTRQGLTKSLYYVNTYFPLRNEQIKVEVLQLLNELIAVPDTEKQSYILRNTRNAAISLLYRLLNDWENALLFQEKTIRIIEQMQAQKLNRNIPAIAAYYNYISLFINKGDRFNYRIQMDKMRLLPVSGNAEEQYRKAVMLQLELDDIIFNKDLLEGKKIVSEAITFIKEPHPIINIYHDTLIRLATFYIYEKDYNAALSLINKLINSHFIHPLKSFAVHVKLLNILIHFELGNFLLLPGLIRSVYRFMMQQELKYEIEKAILNFFRRIFKLTNQKLIKVEFERLLFQLLEISNDVNEQQALLSYFDYRFWIAGKLIN